MFSTLFANNMQIVFPLMCRHQPIRCFSCVDISTLRVVTTREPTGLRECNEAQQKSYGDEAVGGEDRTSNTMGTHDFLHF